MGHPPILVGTISMVDSFILMVMALVVFGPRRLPQIGRQIGKLMYEFRKASNDFKFQMEEELRNAEDADRRKKEEAERQRTAALAAQSQASVSAPAPTLEASADIGAVEPPVPPGYPEQYAAETSAPAAEQTDTAPVIQPPSTGDQVSASARIAHPDYYFQPSETAGPEPAATEVNPDADVVANAEGLSSGTAPVGTMTVASPEPTPVAENAHPTPSKETVSQHG